MNEWNRVPKRNVRKSTVKKLDKAVSDYVRNRDKACVQCASTKQLGCGHIFSRRAYSTRWDISRDGNCHAQCWKHNFYHSNQDAWPYFKWYIDKFGQAKFDELRKRYKTVRKFSTPELKEMLEEINVNK